MRKEDEFCKIFEIKDHQVLVQKSFNDEDDEEYLSLTTYIDGLRLSANIAGFEKNNSNVDEAFDKYNSESAEKFFQAMWNIVNH